MRAVEALPVDHPPRSGMRSRAGLRADERGAGVIPTTLQNRRLPMPIGTVAYLEGSGGS